MKKYYFLLILTFLLLPLSTVSAHRSGCHRWHSCPSDTGSYVCGDLGYDSGCPKKESSVNKKESACLSKSVTAGDAFLTSKGYKKKKDGNWVNSKGAYPTSKIEIELEKKQTDIYNKCLGKK